MLPDILSGYLNQIESTVQSLKDCFVERYEEEILSPDRANLRIRIRFSKGHLMELNEAIIVEGDKLGYLGYRYHFQDEKDELIFRYDNAPHFPNLETFPHHKHLPNDVTAATKPLMSEVIDEALSPL